MVPSYLFVGWLGATFRLRTAPIHGPFCRLGTADSFRPEMLNWTNSDMTESDIERASIGASDESAEPAIRVLIALAMPFLRTGVRKVLDDAADLDVHEGDRGLITESFPVELLTIGRGAVS